MTTGLDVTAARTCVWMSAGVLTYKLCDRQFDCEHCPLDAALRGAAPARLDSLHTAGVRFPPDRIYTEVHTWLRRAARGERVRFGLDEFAAAMFECPREIRGPAVGELLQPGETLCAIVFSDGVLKLGAPCVAQIGARNHALDEDPGMLLADPYGDGWIADLIHVNDEALGQFLPASAAHERARLDLRRLRRRIAMRLLANDTPGHAAGNLSGEPWHIVDAAERLGALREIVH